LSKARCRWGVEAFQQFFERIVWQCVETGLANSSKLSLSFYLLLSNIRDAIYSFGKEFFFTMRGYVRPTPERL
jgi:hypothetical protein